ncbi:eCIS core domain-containing protein, partial [Corallococcus terminator]|uniref:eCIS core domain-containing protein n=1 Tax=Corallococcus terminator TaxID=2316733 RepID=UPI0011C3A5D0
MDARHRCISPSLLEQACARGWALPKRLRVRFERAFGAELSGVRLHEHPLVASLGAKALCWGEQILFAPGALELDSARGTRILAHELVHVLQQRAGRVPHGNGGAGLLVDGALEAEAEALAVRALSGERAHFAA